MIKAVFVGYILRCTATHCAHLQHTEIHCNTLQHTTTYCNKNRSSEAADASVLFSFELDYDSKDAEDVDPNLVLPPFFETKVSKP